MTLSQQEYFLPRRLLGAVPVERQADHHDQPSAACIPGHNAATMPSHRIGGDGKAKSVTTTAPITRFLDPVERLENLFQFAIWHAEAILPPRPLHTPPATALLQTENHPLLGVGVAQGIA